MMKSNRIRLLIIPALLMLSAIQACHRGVAPRVAGVVPGVSPGVRVRLINGQGPLSVGAEAGVLLFADLGNGEKIVAIESGAAWSVVLFGPKGELRVASPDGHVSRPHPDGIKIWCPGGSGLFKIGGRTYRGELLVHNAGGSRIMAVNRLPLEEYLRSVVPSEIGNPGGGAYQAMKVQAVCARSYAMALMSQNRKFSYDLTADTGDQVYKGNSNEHHLTDSAVYETAGECLAYDGQVLTSFYHSTCGGRTADPVEVWGELFAERNSWLRPVDDGSWDSESRWASWSVSWSRKQLLLQLKQNLPAVVKLSGAEIGEPTDIEVMSKGPSGRNTLLKVTTDKRVLQVAGDNIRRALRQPDGSMLPSTMFDLNLQRGGASGVSIVANGRGFGHGLGMCQSGAIARANAGQGYREILDHYFPKARLAKIY